MNRQRLTSILYCYFLTNLEVQSLHLEQTQDFQSLFVLHCKVAGSVDKKVIFVTFWLNDPIFEQIVTFLCFSLSRTDRTMI